MKKNAIRVIAKNRTVASVSISLANNLIGELKIMISLSLVSRSVSGRREAMVERVLFNVSVGVITDENMKNNKTRLMEAVIVDS